MKRTWHMTLNYEGIGAIVVKVDAGNNFWLEGYILTDYHSKSPLVELDRYITDAHQFKQDIAEALKNSHVLSVSTAKFFFADIFTQERIVAELIKAVIYDARRGIK